MSEHPAHESGAGRAGPRGAGEEGDPWAPSRSRAQRLLERVDGLGSVTPTTPSDHWVIAALFRCTHLLGAMLAREDPRDPLVPLGLRDLIETSINGLLCDADSAHIDRFARKDRDVRLAMAAQVADTAGLEEAITAMYPELADGPGPLPFHKRVAELWKLRPELFGGDDDPARISGTYMMVCNFLMHGGIGIIGAYLERDGDGGLVVERSPDLPLGDADMLEVALNFTERLLGIVVAKVTPPDVAPG